MGRRRAELLALNPGVEVIVVSNRVRRFGEDLAALRVALACRPCVASGSLQMVGLAEEMKGSVPR